MVANVVIESRNMGIKAPKAGQTPMAMGLSLWDSPIAPFFHDVRNN